MNIFVTGGSGFVGTNLVEYYASKGCKVLNVDIAAPRNPAHFKYWQKADILDRLQLGAIVRDFSPDIIFHMAARTDLDSSVLADYSANMEGVESIIDAACGLAGLQRVIFASSMLVCRLGYLPKNEEDYCPTTAYGESKVVGERLVRSKAATKFPWTIVRPTSLWGPWFGVPYKNFFDTVAAGMYGHPRGRRIRRSYGFVLNAVHQLHQLASCQDSNAVNSKTFYLADFVPIELYEWAVNISLSYGVSPPKEVPLSLLRLLARMGDLLKRFGMHNPPLSSFRLNNLLTDAVFDMRSLQAVVGPIPYGANDAVRITVDWIKSQSK